MVAELCCRVFCSSVHLFTQHWEMCLEWELGSQAGLGPVQRRPAVDAQRETLTGCEVAWDPGAGKAPARAGSPAGTGGVFPLCLFWFASV